MKSRKSILGLGIFAALAYAGIDWVDQNVEVVTLHTTGRMNDHYPRLFVVDDPPMVWVRAERPDRIWLASLRQNSNVVVNRGGRDIAYHAEVWEGHGSTERIDRLFREKYGAVDAVAGFLWRRDSLPVQLEPSDEYARRQ